MKYLVILISSLSLLTACGDNSSKKNDDATKSTSETVNKPIVVEKIEEGPQFPDATLLIKDVTTKAIPDSDSVELTFTFDVQNYELKAQTPDASSRSCNNSKDGQHIHFILNNEPYTALYEPKHVIKVKKGTENVLLTFLSRSYHLSLKNEKAYQLLTFKINEKGEYQKLENSKEPMLFYSRPKGTYLGADVQNVLLDFYVLNANEQLKSGEYFVHLNVDGHEERLNVWAPYFIKNLPLKEITMTIALVDKDINVIGNNKIQRKITLAESEPIVK